jgi:hypothetical protein
MVVEQDLQGNELKRVILHQQNSKVVFEHRGVPGRAIDHCSAVGTRQNARQSQVQGRAQCAPGINIHGGGACGLFGRGLRATIGCFLAVCRKLPKIVFSFPESMKRKARNPEGVRAFIGFRLV